MVLPVKEVAGRDLALVCHFRRLPLAPLPVVRQPCKPSVNALAQEFVDAMQVLSYPGKFCLVLCNVWRYLRACSPQAYQCKHRVLSLCIGAVLWTASGVSAMSAVQITLCC